MISLMLEDDFMIVRESYLPTSAKSRKLIAK